MPFRLAMHGPPRRFHRDLPGTPANGAISSPPCATDCPVCKRPLPVLSLPGRPQIYCSNACRQWAYRWRREHRVRLIADGRHRAERGSNRRCDHALRDDRDPVAHTVDDRARRVSVCGTYVRAASDHPSLATEFVPEGSPRACRRCTALIGMPPPDSLEAVGAHLEWMATLPWLPDAMKADCCRQLATFIRLRPALEEDPVLAAHFIAEQTGLAA